MLDAQNAEVHVAEEGEATVTALPSQWRAQKSLRNSEQPKSHTENEVLDVVSFRDDGGNPRSR